MPKQDNESKGAIPKRMNKKKADPTVSLVNKETMPTTKKGPTTLFLKKKELPKEEDVKHAPAYNSSDEKLLRAAEALD